MFVAHHSMEETHVAGKPFFACKFGNCTNFAGFLCRSCGRMLCRQHYNWYFP
jgi:hypothetical protein